MEVARAVRRGRFPADPGEHAAARDQMERMSRSRQKQHDMRWLSWLLLAVWPVFAVRQPLEGHGGFAGLYSLSLALWTC
ncbi:hypothetical protein [Streptomyces sp. NPDC007088]|uniref:hypothetical protein n=1 Tax=Streptomyces sp. NPDC007088 TaxID=3364773 RepID=UPI0036910424